MTVLHYAGVGLFAEVPRIDELWPKVADSTNAVVVLSMGTLPDVPSSKVIRAIRKWATDLEANGGRMYIAGVSPAARRCSSAAGSATCSAPTASSSPPPVFGGLDEARRAGPAVDRRPRRPTGTFRQP